MEERRTSVQVGERRGRYLNLDKPVCKRCGRSDFIATIQVNYFLEDCSKVEHLAIRGRVYCAVCRKQLERSSSLVILGSLLPGLKFLEGEGELSSEESIVSP